MRLAQIFRVIALLATLATGAAAQDWPTHPLRLIVPFPAGGSADVQSRVIAEALSKALGQPVVVENKPGAGGNIGAAEAARAEPDGYTLFMATTSTHASNISLYKTLDFDPVKDFAPLTLVTLNPQIIVAAPQYGNLNFSGLVAKLKNAGTAASFGSSGIGSATHIAGELFNRATGSTMVHVPYRGQGPALNDLLGNRIDVMFPLVADVFSFLRSGQLKALAVMSDRRAKSLPDVPDHRRAGLSATRAHSDLDRALRPRRNAAADRRTIEPRTHAVSFPRMTSSIGSRRQGSKFRPAHRVNSRPLPPRRRRAGPG